MLQGQRPTNYHGNFAEGRSRKRGAFWNGAEAIRQWALQSVQHRPMASEHRNPRHLEPIGVGSPSQWEGGEVCFDLSASGNQQKRTFQRGGWDFHP